MPRLSETHPTVGGLSQELGTSGVGDEERDASQMAQPASGHAGDLWNDFKTGSGASLLCLTVIGFCAILPFEA
jgi:hypothetical protein